MHLTNAFLVIVDVEDGCFLDIHALESFFFFALLLKVSDPFHDIFCFRTTVQMIHLYPQGGRTGSHFALKRGTTHVTSFSAKTLITGLLETAVAVAEKVPRVCRLFERKNPFLGTQQRGAAAATMLLWLLLLLLDLHLLLRLLSLPPGLNGTASFL
jgi:hypothetical protein